jgi:hypothetical protein
MKENKIIMKPKDFTFSTTKIFRIFVFAIIGLATSMTVQATVAVTSAPTNVSASVGSSTPTTTATVFFTAPAATITTSGSITYTVTSSPGGLTATSTQTYTSASASTYSNGSGSSGITVTGLTTGTPYTFTVRAVGNGSGDFTSSSSNSITPRTVTTCTFNGGTLGTGTDWGTNTNWDTGTIPTANDIAIISNNKAVVIGSGTNALASRLSLLAGASLTNNTGGAITLSPTDLIGSALTLQGNCAFDNEGTLTVSSINQTTASNTISITGNGSAANVFTFNGITNLAAKSSVTVFSINVGATATIGGSGFTIGSLASPSLSSVLNFTSPSSFVTVNSGTTINMYLGGSAQGIYLSSSTSFTNNGTINIMPGTGVTGTTLHGIQMWETTASVQCTLTNAGTLSVTGFQQPTVFGGAVSGTNYGKFINTGTATINSSDVTGALGLYSTVVPNQFSNSGTLNLGCAGTTNVTYAIKLSAVAGQSFTNTGTINITKGSIISTGTISASTAPTMNNNSGGVFNFNYGVSAGSTAATTTTVILNNNSGATINGSCTFAAGTLVTAAGSTLSPGDYSGGVSGYGTIVLTPSAAGTKFPLYGSLLMQIKGKTTPGTDFDKISCTELDVTNATMTVTADYTTYTPAVNDYLVLDYSGTSKTGPFSSTSMPRGWLYESTTTNEAAKYYPSVPGAPTSVVATAGNAQASVAFTAPASDGGADITLYTVTSSPGGFTGTGSSSPVVVTGLINVTAYTFTVTATNIRGTGAGTASSAVTPSATANDINVSSSNFTNLMTLTPVSDVVVANGALLTINTQVNINSLTIAGGGQVTNTSSLIASAITINSDGTNGTGTYNDYGGSTSVTSATVKQYLSSSSSRNWYMSSPVSGASSLPTVDGGVTFYSYPESDSRQENGTTYPNPVYAAGAVWNTVSGATTMAFGTGYVVKPSAATSTVTFSGTGLNTGNQTISGLTYTPANPKHGFNLIGNPYPSYLNVLPSISANSAGVEPTVWYRTRDAAGYYHCETVNSTDGFGTNSSLTGRVTGYIPPMQGFWVRTKLNNQSIALSNSNRSHTTTVTQPGVGSVPTTPLKAPTLKNETYGLLGLNVFNGITGDETIIKFYSGATNNLDAYDSGKMSNGNVNIPELFTVVEGSQLAINTMNSIPYDSEIALGFTTGKSGDFTINTSLMSNFAEGTQILLKDNIDPLNPVITDLAKQSYSFNSDTTTSNTSRFTLIFKAPSVATVINPESNGNVWISTRNGQIVVNGTTNRVMLEVFNTVGQKVISKNLGTTNMLLNNNLAAGAYLVKLTTEGKSITRKIIID